MDGYVKDIMSKYKVTMKCSTPATDNLFKCDPLSPRMSKAKDQSRAADDIHLLVLIHRCLLCSNID